MKNVLYFLLCGLAGSLIGLLIFYFSGDTFNAQGSFLIKPSVKLLGESEESLYDLDLLSSSYTQTLVGILNSPEIKKEVLKSLEKENNLQNLVWLSFKVNAKEIAPRLVILTVSGTQESEATKLFESYEKEVFLMASQFGENGIFEISRLTEEILVIKVAKNILLNFFVGYVVGFFSSLIVLFLKEKYRVVRK